MKKKSNNFALILVFAIVFFAVIIGRNIPKLPDPGQAVVDKNQIRADLPENANESVRDSDIAVELKTTVDNPMSIKQDTNEKVTMGEKPAAGPNEKNGLIELPKLDDTFIIDLKYATEDNFTGKKIYNVSKCIIHKGTAKKLISANNEFKKLGYRIKIFDAYRPYSVQQILWDAASNKSYIANPKKGSVHNRGAAVDITLADSKGKELPMPSGYDEFSKRAHLDYLDCPDVQIKNRELLGKIMVKHGFKRISKEWWHFEDTDAKNYPTQDIPLEDF